MALELTWGEMRSYDLSEVSTVAAIYKSTVFAWKQFLTGAIGPNNAGVWTVVSSSNGAGNYGSSDLWASTANIVGATAGNNHSWILLRQTTLGVDLLFDCASVTYQYYPTVYAAPTGTFTGGSATAAPSSLQFFGHVASGNRQINNNTAGTASRINGLLSTRGDFWLLFSHSGTNVVYSALGLSKLSDVKTNDPFPWALWITSTNLGFAKQGVHPMEGGNGGAMAMPCIHCRGYSGVRPTNDYVYNAAGVVWPTVASSSSSFPNDTYVSASPLDRTALTQSDGKSLTFPVYVGITQANIQDFKGRWPDALLGSAGVAVNTASPSVEAQQYIKAGPHMWLPFSGGILGL